jgi:hypothetical protein
MHECSPNSFLVIRELVALFFVVTELALNCI